MLLSILIQIIPAGLNGDVAAVFELVDTSLAVSTAFRPLLPDFLPGAALAAVWAVRNCLTAFSANHILTYQTAPEHGSGAVIFISLTTGLSLR